MKAANIRKPHVLDNIREPLQRDPAIGRLIALHERHFDVTNQLEVVDERRQVQLIEEERQLVYDIEMTRHQLHLQYG